MKRAMAAAMAGEAAATTALVDASAIAAASA
jgi:hypothetical protein